MLDMVPDIVNKFTAGKVNVGEQFSADAVKTAEGMAAADPVVEPVEPTAPK